MERQRPRRRKEACLFPMDMSVRVKRITRLHQLAEAESLLGSDQRATLWREAAVNYGVCVITLTEGNKKEKKALDNALEWLRGRDYEMHRTVQDTLDQARAKRELTKRVKKVAKITGNRRRRAA